MCTALPETCPGSLLSFFTSVNLFLNIHSSFAKLNLKFKSLGGTIYSVIWIWCMVIFVRTDLLLMLMDIHMSVIEYRNASGGSFEGSH